MSDKTFREEVEEILNNPQPCGHCRPNDYLECNKTEEACLLDRICAAAERMAERMPKPDPSRFINEAFRDGFDVGADWTLRDNQAHIRKEIGK